MAENNDVPGNADADEPTTVLEGQAVPPAAPAPVPAAAPQSDGPRLRDTVWNFRSMVLVAVGSLIIGGALGAALVAASTRDDGPDRVRITGFRGAPDGQGPRGFQGYGQGQGQPGLPGLSGLTDEQRQKLRDFVEKQLENLGGDDGSGTPTPSPSPGTAG